jgi:predicted nucleic acid-binding protein
MARGHSREYRGLAGPHHPGPTRTSEGRRTHKAVHEARRFGAGTSRPVVTERILAVVTGIADTGFLVAFANRHDRHHAWAVELATQITAPLLTCEAVLAEAAFHLQSVETVLALVREGLVEVAFDCRDHWVQLESLARRYADRKPDLADLCLVRLSELHPRHSVITVDREDFKVYRRNKRETIPIVCPPEK